MANEMPEESKTAERRPTAANILFGNDSAEEKLDKSYERWSENYNEPGILQE